MAIGDIFTGAAGDWWKPAAGSMWLDSGGTSAATANNETLGRLTGQQGSINLLQTTHPNHEPTLKTALTPAGFNAYLCDGSGDRWDDFNLNFGSPGQSTFFWAAKRTALGSYHNFYEADTGGAYEPNCWSAPSNIWEVNGSGSPGALKPVGANPGDDWHTGITRADDTNGCDLWINGTQVDSATASGASGHPTGSKPVSWHNRSGGATFNGWVAVIGVIARRISNGEVTALHTDLNAYIAAAAAGKPATYYYHQYSGAGGF